MGLGYFTSSPLSSSFWKASSVHNTRKTRSRRLLPPAQQQHPLAPGILQRDTAKSKRAVVSLLLCFLSVLQPLSAIPTNFLPLRMGPQQKPKYLPPFLSFSWAIVAHKSLSGRHHGNSIKVGVRVPVLAIPISVRLSFLLSGQPTLWAGMSQFLSVARHKGLLKIKENRSHAHRCNHALTHASILLAFIQARSSCFMSVHIWCISTPGVF